MKKTFEALTTKMTKKKKKKKKKKMRDQERNRSDRQKDILKKSDLIPICFKNSKSN